MPQNLTVQKILGVLLHRIRFILIVALAAGLMTFLYTNFFITPQYSASTMIFVQNYNKKSNTDNTNASNNRTESDSARYSFSELRQNNGALQWLRSKLLNGKRYFLYYHKCNRQRPRKVRECCESDFRYVQ